MVTLQFSKLLEKTRIIKTKEIQIEFPSKPVRYYRHGWQSWSLAAWTDPNPLPVQMPAIFHPLQLDAQHVHKKYLNGSWLGAVEFADGNVLLLGALATDTNVSLVQNQLSGWSEVDETEWFIGFGPETALFEEYAEQLGNRLGVSKKKDAPRVWCSWYSLYYGIDETILHQIFNDLGDLSFDVLQVDDGWEVDVGYWEANKKFPSGMKALADKIKSTGRRAGLWLAPLIVQRSSRLFRDPKHAEWFLRGENGQLVSAGFNWGEQVYALDTTHPDVILWLTALMKQVRAWGFDYLKLDFLYAGALKGKRHKDIPREAAYREALQVMRDAMGTEAFFLTCGTPILPAIGICDAIRIGPDVSYRWETFRDATLLYNPTIPGTKNAIRTSLNRLWLKPLVHIDPDVAYFESKGNSLKQEQRNLLQDLAYICNFKATSDLPQWMTKDELGQLTAFLHTSPIVKQAGRYVFNLDGRMVDFTNTIPLPEIPKGLIALWARCMGWLGDRLFVLKTIKMLNNIAVGSRRKSLKTHSH
jgi:alpha-galactosidase